MLLVDGDEQGTAAAFTDLRAGALGAPGYTAVVLQGAALRTQVRQLAPKYDDIVIDVGGRNTGSLRAALTVADTLLIPVQPRTFDVWSVEQMADWSARRGRSTTGCALSPSSTPPIPPARTTTRPPLRWPRPTGSPASTCAWVRRKAFPNAAATGRSVVEQAGQDPKAAAELATLVAALYDGVCISE